MNNNEEVKEDFCPSCLAIPLAMAGVGVSAAGSKKGNHQKKRKMMLWIGISMTVVFSLIAIYFLFIKKCKECR